MYIVVTCVFQSLEEGDILVGMVSAVQESGLIVTMLCMDNGKIRNVEDMKITVRTSFEKIIPSNAVATFVQSTKIQIFLKTI